MTLQQAAERAAQMVRATPATTRWLLACDTDADGLCAAAVTYHALRLVGRRATVRPSRDKDSAYYLALAREDVDGLILLDKGTSHMNELAGCGKPVLVLDHHNLVGPVPAGVTLVNPRAEGMDGSRDASAATVAVAFALELAGPRALAWAGVGLAGAIGDWQHMGGWRGWNLQLRQQAVSAGAIRTDWLPRIIGTDLAEALAHHPLRLAGLHGDVAAASRLLEDIALTGKQDVESLDVEEATRLVSAVVLSALAAGGVAQGLDGLVEQGDFDLRLGLGLREAFRVIDACGREGKPSTGIACLLGDPEARREALGHLENYRKSILDGIRTLRRDGVTAHEAFQSAWTQRPAYSGMVAGIGMTHTVKDQLRPLCILARRGDGRVQVSLRGLNEQVEAGLDLGRAARVAAEAVGSEGGGHPVAAGAVIAEDQVTAFLEVLDSALVRQAFLGNGESRLAMTSAHARPSSPQSSSPAPPVSSAPGADTA